MKSSRRSFFSQIAVVAKNERVYQKMIRKEKGWDIEKTKQSAIAEGKEFIDSLITALDCKDNPYYNTEAAKGLFDFVIAMKEYFEAEKEEQEEYTEKCLGVEFDQDSPG